LLPDDLKENKGHNVFYCLPLILGLLGLFWQAWYTRKRKVGEKTIDDPIGIRQFWVVFFLFFMTGLAIVIYLNQTPMQPRERDYAYAGSFYAFAIWCGMGVAAIINWLERKLKKENLILAAVVSIACLFVPIQMASQTWDDHDRSGRYCCRDFGQNYLMTLQEKGNPIIFTNGDNDTFPLWYNQDTEGVRTDARVCNLSYLQTDWYIDQMVRPAYDSPSLPITWNRLEYCAGTNEYVQVDPSLKSQVLELYRESPEEAKKQFGEEPFELKNILNHWVRSSIKDFHVIPTDTVYVTIDKEAVRRSGMMMASDSIPDKMVISLKGKGALYKGDLMMLELIANANWERPIYVATTVGQENYMNLGENFVQEGLANRITPFHTHDTDSRGNLIPVAGVANFDTEKVYDNVMNKYKYGNVSQKGIYLDETVTRMCYTHRRLLSTLAINLINEGKIDKAKAVLDKCEKELPGYNVAHDYASGSIDMARAYNLTGQKEKAQQMVDLLWKKSQQYLQWYCSLDGYRFNGSQRDIQINIIVMNQLVDVQAAIDEKKGTEKEQQLDALVQLYYAKGGKFEQ